MWKSSGYQDKTELAKVSLVLAVPGTEPNDIINIFSQIEGITFNQNKIVVNPIIKINVQTLWSVF